MNQEGKYAEPKYKGKAIITSLLLLLCVGVVGFLIYNRSSSITPKPTVAIQENTSSHLEMSKSLSDNPAERDTVKNDSCPSVKSWSVHLPRSAYYVGDIDTYLICTDPVEMQQGSHYEAYSMEDNNLVLWENQSLSVDFPIMGQNVHAEFDYGVLDDKVVTTHIAPFIPENCDNSIRFIHDTSKGIHRVLLGFNIVFPDESFLHYPVYLDLETGEVTDFLAGFDQDALRTVLSDEIFPIAIFEDNYMLLQKMGGRFYCLNTNRNAVYNLEVLSGKLIQDCTLLDGEVLCWNEQGEFWSINLEDGTRSPIIQVPQVAFARGFRYEKGGLGCSFCLYWDDSKTLHLYDFLTGEDMPMTHPDGWDMQDASFMPGDSGRSVLVYTTGRDENIYTVLDVDTHTFCPLPVTQSQTETLTPIVFTKRDEVVFTTGDYADYYFYQPQ